MNEKHWVKVEDFAYSNDQCPSNYKQYGNDILATPMWIELPFSSLEKATTPPNDTNKVWVQVDSQGAPVRIWTYHGTYGWVSPHCRPQYALEFYDQDPNSIDTYDGGSAGEVTAYSGPFWSIVTEFAGRFPVGVGQRNAESRTYTVGVPTEIQDGNEEVMLGLKQIPIHYHGTGWFQTGGNDNFKLICKYQPEQAGVAWSIGQFNRTTDFSLLGTEGGQTGTSDGMLSDGNLRSTPQIQETTSSDPHNRMEQDKVDIHPPHYGVYLIRRTARTYYSYSP
jgi:hypothetical protein